MTTFKQQTTSERSIDWPIIFFFILAYTIAWGAFAILGIIARQSGIDNAQTLLVMGESFQFEGASLIVPPWLVYLLTRLADFAFSIAGVIMIAVTAGRVGLRELWQRLTRWRKGFETLFPALVGTDWELISTLSLLLLGIVAGIVVWRNGRFNDSLSIISVGYCQLNLEQAELRQFSPHFVGKRTKDAKEQINSGTHLREKFCINSLALEFKGKKRNDK